MKGGNKRKRTSDTNQKTKKEGKRGRKGGIEGRKKEGPQRKGRNGVEYANKRDMEKRR